MFQIVQKWSNMLKPVLTCEFSNATNCDKFELMTAWHKYEHMWQNIFQVYMWKFWPIVTNIDNCDKLIMTIITYCDSYDQLWQFWPFVIILTNCDTSEFMPISKPIEINFKNTKSIKSMLLLADWVWPSVSHVLNRVDASNFGKHVMCK